MSRLAIFSFVAVFLFTASTCERPVDLEFEEPDPRLVVISNFTHDKALKVQVSRSRSVLSSGTTEFVLDATVDLLKDEDLLETLDLVPGVGKNTPYYTTRTTIPEIDMIYTIRVEAPGFEPVTAQSRIPRRIAIRSVEVGDLEVIPGANDNEMFYSYVVRLSFEDPPEEENYYHLNLFQQIHNYLNIEGDTTILNTFLQKIEFSPAIDNNSIIANFDGGVLFEDEEFNGKLAAYAFELGFRIDPASELLGKVFVELRTVSEEYYLYHNSLSRQQDSPGIPLSEPVILYNNIMNGHGIFAGYSLSVDSLSVVQ